ncbi:MAG: hypothetical protein AB8H79_16105 [Myxococcota bacterium]
MHPSCRWLAALPLLCACSDPDVDAVDPVTPAPYVLDEVRDDPNDVDLGALGAALQRSIDGLFELNATPVLDAYSKATEGQTPVCPRTYAMNGNVYWFDQCTSEDGTQFSGYGFYYDYVDYPIGDAWVGDYTLINGAARVETPNGNALDIAGAASLISATHSVQPANLYRSEIRGSFGWDGSEADGTWLGSGLNPDLSLQVYERTDVDGRMVQVDGGVSGMSGDIVAIVFDGVTLIETNLGGTCPAEPHGIISMRTSTGTWVDVVFDGPDPQTFVGDASKCDGKGRAFYRGEILGEIAADFSTLYPTEAPW